MAECKERFIKNFSNYAFLLIAYPGTKYRTLN